MYHWRDAGRLRRTRRAPLSSADSVTAPCPTSGAAGLLDQDHDAIVGELHVCPLGQHDKQAELLHGGEDLATAQ